MRYSDRHNPTLHLCLFLLSAARAHSRVFSNFLRFRKDTKTHGNKGLCPQNNYVAQPCGHPYNFVMLMLYLVSASAASADAERQKTVIVDPA